MRDFFDICAFLSMPRGTKAEQILRKEFHEHRVYYNVIAMLGVIVPMWLQYTVYKFQRNKLHGASLLNGNLLAGLQAKWLGIVIEIVMGSAEAYQRRHIDTVAQSLSTSLYTHIADKHAEHEGLAHAHFVAKGEAQGGMSKLAKEAVLVNQIGELTRFQVLEVIFLLQEVGKTVLTLREGYIYFNNIRNIMSSSSQKVILLLVIGICVTRVHSQYLKQQESPGVKCELKRRDIIETMVHNDALILTVMPAALQKKLQYLKEYPGDSAEYAPIKAQVTEGIMEWCQKTLLEEIIKYFQVFQVLSALKFVIIVDEFAINLGNIMWKLATIRHSASGARSVDRYLADLEAASNTALGFQNLVKKQKPFGTQWINIKGLKVLQQYVGKESKSIEITVGNSAALQVSQKDIILVRGPSGVGKSTLCQAITYGIGVQSSTSWQQAQDSKIYMSLSSCVLDPTLTLRQNLIHDSSATDDIECYMKQLGLEHFLCQLDKAASAVHPSDGEKKRLALIQALKSGASVIILDEPFNGLDTASIKQVKALIKKEAKKGIAFIIIDHTHALQGEHSEEVAEEGKGKEKVKDSVGFEYNQIWTLQEVDIKKATTRQVRVGVERGRG